MNKKQRLDAANRLKAAFNLMWDRALEISEHKGQQNTVSYRDIVRISDAIRAEGSKILGLSGLPKQIDSGLSFACAATDPNKVRAEETIKNGLSGLGGAGGLALAWVCLGQLMNPGMWAIVVAFFTGGIAGGPLAIVGIAAGLLVMAGAVFTAFQKMSPEERAAKAHNYVMHGIDNWVEYGSDDVAVSYEDAKKSVETSAARYGMSFQDILAPATLMMNVANADGVFVDVERHTINLLLKDTEVSKRLRTSEALEYIKRSNPNKAAEIIDWCFQIAHADGIFHSNEVEALKRYCKELNVDFSSKARLYSVKTSL